MNRLIKRPVRGIALLILLSFLTQAPSCNPNFGGQLRTIFDVSDVFLSSLNLGEHRAAVAQDFTDLGRRSADLSDDLSACQGNPCKLEAVNRFQIAFFDIERRGHFGLHPTLQKIEMLTKGVIAAARIYFGAKPPAGVEGVSPQDAEKDLKVKLKELKETTRQ